MSAVDGLIRIALAIILVCLAIWAVALTGGVIAAVIRTAWQERRKRKEEWL